jgi:hypothetical protein
MNKYEKINILVIAPLFVIGAVFLFRDERVDAVLPVSKVAVNADKKISANKLAFVTMGTWLGNSAGASSPSLTDPSFLKKLVTSTGKSISIQKFYVYFTDDSDWLAGGKLHLQSGNIMGDRYAITCSLSAASGDKFMADNKNRKLTLEKGFREVALDGVILKYSIHTGLTIDPCSVVY